MIKPVVRICKICHKTLYTPREIAAGLCEDHLRSSASLKCVRCGANLALPNEKSAKLCLKCQRENIKCLKCGATLFTAEERKNGLCRRCSRRT